MSEAPSPAARDGGPREHAPASSRKPRTSPAIPPLPKARLAFLILAGAACSQAWTPHLCAWAPSRPWPRRAWGPCTDSS